MADRSTKDPARAIPRAAKALDLSVERLDGGRWLVRIPKDPDPPMVRDKWGALAFLADLMQTLGLDPDPIKFTGIPPGRGLSAWQVQALSWLSRAL